MPIVLKEFQQTLCEQILDRFRSVKDAYGALPGENRTGWNKIRTTHGTAMLQAPTGSGKTVLAIEIVSRFSETENLLWFWFAPFSGVIDQTRKSLREGAPRLSPLDMASDRKLDLISGGGVFVTTWQSVATRNTEGRKARQSGDLGLSVDELIAAARDDGMRIGCVVDEAHHSFHKAPESRNFFTEVLRPDYTLLMTATPNNRDVKAFSKATGFSAGLPDEWFSVSRHHGVQAGLLKKGVKMARFIAKKDDEKRLIRFEHTAMSECALMHREIQSALAEAGIELTPLMLVQVPNGKKAQEAARDYLIRKENFPEDAVRIHTAKEPDPDLIALANDPKIEVLLFKMAVAMGFDAPRAWTLAALRGARDTDFGVQVIGRLMRVHKMLQARSDLPEFLEYGYVYLANDEAQEGLLSAGAVINEMETRNPQLGSQIVITCYGDEKQAQVVKNGENIKISIEMDEDGSVRVENATEAGKTKPDSFQGKTEQQSLFAGNTNPEPKKPEAENDGKASGKGSLVEAFRTDAKAKYRYRRKPEAPGELETEFLPDVSDDFEERVLAHIDFGPVIADRERVKAGLKKVDQDVFDTEGKEIEESDVFAYLEPAEVAKKAQQLVLRFEDIDRARFPELLREKFRNTLVELGIEPPEDLELLERQLDLVLVRNPALLREAYRKSRVSHVGLSKVALPAETVGETPLEASPKNLYGIWPPDLNADERSVARMLDGDPNVAWWHRNSVRKPDSVALYGWAEGQGFFPDFVVKILGRKAGDGIALLEVKGPHIREAEPRKAAAVHRKYGRVFMVGRKKPGKEAFAFFRFEEDKLQEDGTFEVVRMKWGD